MEEKKGENLNKENFVRINFCCPSFEGVSSPRIVNWLANPQEIELTEEILNNFRKEINAYNDLFSFGRALFRYSLFDLIEITERLYECILEIRKWGKIPSSGKYKNLWRNAYKASEDTREELSKMTSFEISELMEFREHVRPPEILELKYLSPAIQKDISENKQSPEEIFTYISNLGKHRMREEQTLEYCYQCCIALLKLFNSGEIGKYNGLSTYEVDMSLITRMAHELIGFWRAWLIVKIGKRNIALNRTNKKEDRKNQIRDWMKIMEEKEIRLKAQKEFEITDRAVLNYLHEIKKEENSEKT